MTESFAEKIGGDLGTLDRQNPAPLIQIGDLRSLLCIFVPNWDGGGPTKKNNRLGHKNNISLSNNKLGVKCKRVVNDYEKYVHDKNVKHKCFYDAI